MNSKVMFVCLGNICRSPMAEAVFNHIAAEKGISDSVMAASSGTAGYHEGGNADSRTIKTLRSHGVPINHTAHKITKEDIAGYDLIFAMDSENLHNIERLAGGADKKIMLFRKFDPKGQGDVPDPYYGSEADFEIVYEMCLRTCEKIIEHIMKENA
ncbi:MAG: low molecular weight phosphotyrosine protein phosphatase [Spirochaetes bacterium]|nr:low molecular weight phosphotyrosine protein phosphatase [Spirochaetota bacterium]